MDTAAPRTILLVDNERLAALRERELLEKRGYRVSVARTGEEAILMTAANPAIDLVLMDTDLGAGIDGIETAAAMHGGRQIPVVFVLSRNDSAVLDRIADADSYGLVLRDSGDAALLASIAIALRCAARENKVCKRAAAASGSQASGTGASLTETGSTDGFTVDFRIVSDRARDDSAVKLGDWLKDITRHTREEAKWAARLADKEMQLREAHHRIKNNIASLQSLLVMQSESMRNPEAASALHDAVRRMESMRVLYDMLLISNDCREVGVIEYVQGLVDASIAMFPSTVKLAVTKRVDDFRLDSKRLACFGIIINELLTNTMKYAFRGKQEGSIRVEMRRRGDQIVLTVGDDGNGLPRGFDLRRSEGFGLSLVAIVSERLGGTFSIANNHGTRSVVRAPDGIKPGAAVKMVG